MNHFLRITLFSIVSLVTFFSLQSCTTSNAPTQEELSGYWVLKSLKGEEASDAFKGSIPSLELDFGKLLVYGSAGCNRYTGEFTLKGDVFKASKVATTMMLCIEENKEDLFVSTLSNEKGLTISVNQEVLSLKDGDTVVIEFIKEKTSTKVATTAISSENLVGAWTLSKINGDSTTTFFGDTTVSLNYTSDGSISGNAGCNNYNSKATLTENTITIEPIATTRMACPNLEGEQTFLGILSAPLEISIKDSTLILSQENKPVLEFTRVEG